MSSKHLKTKIEDLEQKILQSSDNVDQLKKELNRLKVLEFEESLREDGEKQLLQG
jgi:predicted RNase H-like nuclease (RuvC/YqgF family)